MRKIDLSSVNWWDGMMVSQADLLAQERYHDETLAWLRRNEIPLYGLISGRSGDHPPLEVSASLVGDDRLRVEIVQCRAVTRDGSVIDVDAGSAGGGGGPLVGMLDLVSRQRQTIPVYVRASGEKCALGEPGPTGQTPRRRWAYQVVLDERQILDDGSALKVAELTVADFQIEQDPTFIPPCLAIGATPAIARVCGQFAGIAQETFDACASGLGGAGAGVDSHAWLLDARRALAMMVSGWAAGLDDLRAGDAVPPADFFIAAKSWLRVFGAALICHPSVRETLDQKFLQAGGLPVVAGGADFHQALAQYLESPYIHESLGPLLRAARDHAANIQACVRFLTEEMGKGGGDPVAAPRPKVTYRQQDYYQLEVGEVDHSFTEETQVLYFRDLGTRAIRSVLFVLKNNAPSGVNERDIRLKGGVNEDRALFCPDLAPDFQERPGQIYLLMDIESGKRDAVDYFSIRSSGLVDFRALLQEKDTDIRIYYL